MKQTTKVLLPLGLFMSIVIPVTIKALFTDSDFFSNDEISKIDYLQPYKIKPENSLDMPNTVVASVEPQQISRVQDKSYYNHTKEDNKVSIPKTDISSDVEAELQLELQREYNTAP